MIGKDSGSSPVLMIEVGSIAPFVSPMGSEIGPEQQICGSIVIGSLV